MNISIGGSQNKYCRFKKTSIIQREIGWIFSPSNPIGALMEVLIAGLNCVNNSWRANPALTTIELEVIQIIARLTTFGTPASGTLVSGGAAGNLTALTLARNEAACGIRQVGLRSHGKQLVGYVSTEGHFTLERAFDILGIGGEYLRRIAVDLNGQIHTHALENAIKDDIQQGNQPFCIVANAGTTNCGAVDPLTAMADIAAQYSLWLHVDGAYGVARCNMSKS